MNRYSIFGFFLSLLAFGCQSDPGPRFGDPTVSILPGVFVSPESCARGDAAWIVSEKGCGEGDACQSDASAKLGSVISVGDDGTRTTLISGLKSPNGVAVDNSQNVWVVDGKAKEIVVRRQDGSVVRKALADAGLLNDVTAAPWASETVLITDSTKGRILAAALDSEEIVVSTYMEIDGAPNGIATTPTGEGVVVAGLGDLKIPGKAGLVYEIAPSASDDECAPFKGGKAEAHSIAAPPGRKLDGIERYTRRGVDGYLVSGILDTTASSSPGASDTEQADALLEAKLWFVAPGREPVMAYDLETAKVPGARAVSAADIGVDPVSKDVCVPDLNGTVHRSENGGGARVFLVHGL